MKPFWHNGNYWRPPAWLPNTEGFTFRALLIGDRLTTCSVVKNAVGQHRVSGCDYTALRGWQPLTNQE